MQATAQNAFAYQWDRADGAGFKNGKQTDTAYFALKGTYTVKLRAFGRGGYDTASQTVTITIDDIVNNANFKLLVAKSWKLNPADGANAIIVGTDANPAQYFGGGGIDNCQKDDVYTFTNALKLIIMRTVLLSCRQYRTKLCLWHGQKLYGCPFYFYSGRFSRCCCYNHVAGSSAHSIYWCYRCFI
ncbi:MAG: PKD domain-containing protein [Chitinophagaceae bacterium]